jgi:hypothetical protein
MASDSPTPPIACTLSHDDLRQRFAAIAALTRESLISHKRDGLSIHLHYKIAAAPAVKEMVRKEQECCPFLTFHLHESNSELRLTVNTPESTRAFADSLFDQFTATA